MNQRERLLAMTALAVVILAGCGFLFKFLFLDSLAAINAQIAAAQQELEKKEDEVVKEGLDRQRILRRDPRLAQWQHLSLPEDKNQEKEIKAGRPIEEVKKRHEDSVQVEYERFLTELVTRSGFTPSTVKVSSAPVDRKGAPMLNPKTPAYTRMSFTVQGQSNLDGVVRMMEEFDKTPLLHEVRTLTLTSRAPARTSGQPGGFRRPGATPGAAPGGFPGFPGAAPGGAPGAAPGGFPGFPGAAPGAAPGGFPGFPGAAPGSAPGAAPGGFPGAAPGGVPGAAPGGRNVTQASGDLDVNITVEALLVTGAEKREALLPDAKIQANILADPPRRYTDILAKNMFTGVASESKLSEDRTQVLAVVKLTSIWNNGKRWQATYYDQGKGGEEKRLKPPILDEFSVADKYGNELVKGKAIRLDEDGLIFQADEKFYRWRLGEFLGTVLGNPMKSDEIKVLGLTIASNTTDNQ